MGIRFFRLLCCFLGLLAASATSRANVRITLDSAGLNFGTVDTTAWLDRTLVIHDTSSTAVQIDNITTLGAGAKDFIVTYPTFPSIIGPHTSLYVTIRFKPLALGLRTATLVIETSDGIASLPVIGVGTSEVSSLRFSVSEIDFGAIAPGAVLDTTIWLYSLGPDTATIYGISVGNGAGNTTFLGDFVNSPAVPFRLAPGDSVGVIISFTGYFPLELKEGSLTILGGFASPSVSLKGDLAYGSFTIDPSLVDFGVVYAGEVRDTTVWIVNTSQVSISINDIAPLGGDFSYVNPPAVPLLIRADDSIPVIIRANPGLGANHVGQMKATTKSASTGEAACLLLLTMPGVLVRVPAQQQGSYYCAAPGDIEISVPIKDTSARRFVLSAVMAGDTNATVSGAITLPDTLNSGESQTLTVHLDRSKLTSDTLLLQFVGGEAVFARDTIVLTALPAFAGVTLTALQATDSVRRPFDVRSTVMLAPFNLDTIVVHIASANANVATIDGGSITLAPGLSNARILSVIPTSLGYDVTIVSSTPIAAPAGSSIVTFNVKRFVAIADSALISVSASSPELDGCLLWSSDSLQESALASCGSAELQGRLNGTLVISGIRLLQNPVTDGSLGVSVISAVAQPVTCEIVSSLGQSSATFSTALLAGVNTLRIPLGSLPEGSYYLRMTTAGTGASLTAHFLVAKN